MKKRLIIAIICLLVVGLWADTSGEYGLQIFKISSDADQAAMGGTGAFYANNSFRFMANPAAGNINNYKGLNFNQNYWIFDTSLNSLSYLNSKGKYSFGIGYRYLDYGALDGATDDGQFTGKFYPMDLIVTTGISYRINPSHYVGINVNGIYEKIDIESALGGSVDLGYRYVTMLSGVELAAAVKNMGKTNKLYNEDIDLPFTAEFSFIGKELENYLPAKNAHISSEVKIIKHIDNDKIMVNMGMKTVLHNKFSLKVGYKFNHDTESFSTGFGVKLRRLNIDYAFVPMSGEIDDVHMIQVGLRF